MSLKTKEAAVLSGVSVRTLHHYDYTGLLKPSSYTENGYRLYSDSDLAKLQQILFFRELDFPLSEIAEILNSDGSERMEILKMQKKLLEMKMKRLAGIIKNIEQTISLESEGETMNGKDRFEAFSIKDIEEHRRKYSDEVKEKYGSTSAYLQSGRKTAGYSDKDWKDIMTKGNTILREMSELMSLAPDITEVQATVKKWQQHITDSYYDCSIEILSGLGDIYTADERFKKNIDKTADGLAEFMSRAIKVYYSENKHKD